MKTKEEIIAVIEKIKSLNIALSVADYEAVLHYLKLSTLNPNKIDEERMATCFEEVFTKDIYAKSNFKTIVDKYNSTIEDHQVLQPLPREMPKWFSYYNNTVWDLWKKVVEHFGIHKCEPLPSECPSWFNDHTILRGELWDKIIKHYGTPTKKELVSVEELEKELIHLWGDEIKKVYRGVARHFHDTYSLNPPKRDEFPFNLKRGDLFMNGEFLREFKAIRISIVDIGNQIFSESDCTPYTEPSIHDKFMASLSDEQKKLYEEMKEATK